MVGRGIVFDDEDEFEGQDNVRAQDDDDDDGLVMSELVPVKTLRGGLQRCSTSTVPWPAIKIEVGKYVDVKAFLSSKHRDHLVSSKDGAMVPISSLEGKYVLVCCFTIPVDMNSPEASICQSIEALYSELSRLAMADFVKLVIIAKCKPRLNNKTLFDTFFAWLPFNCLTIPFSDSQSRCYICKSLDLRTTLVPSLAVHPSGEVLMNDPLFLMTYGAQSFPFTMERLCDITLLDEMIRLRLRSSECPIFLAELLQCDNLSQIADDTKTISTSDLANTPVGLYLYRDGHFMDKLQDIHKKCLDKGLKFEVVLVPVPFLSCYDTIFFYNLMKESALKDSTSSSWWAFPFNDKICRTLNRVACALDDQLLILPHGDRFGDLEGKDVVLKYGINAYPFTKDAIVERKLNDLRSCTLEFLLGSAFMSEFYNKNVLIYFDYPRRTEAELYCIVKKSYRKIKRRYPDSVFAFVPLETVFRGESRWVSEMKWHKLPGEKCESLIKHVFMEGAYPDEFVESALVAFGKDGKVLSRFVHDRLPVSSSSECLFEDTLLSETLSQVQTAIW